MKKLLKQKLNNKGLSLIEVLIALAILSIMTIPVFDTFLESMKINHQTMITVSANHVGQHVLELLKSSGGLQDFSHSINMDGGYVETYTGQLDGYDVDVTLTKIDGITYAPVSGTEVNLGNETDTSSPDFTMTYKKAEGGNSHFLFDSQSQTHETTWVKIIFENEASNVKAKMILMKKEGDTWREQTTGSIKNITPSENKVKMNISVSGEPEDGRIDIDNKSDVQLSIYEIDDNASVLRVVPKMTSESGDITLYRNIRSQSASTDNDKLVYNVHVKVSKNSTVLEDFVGTVVK